MPPGTVFRAQKASAMAIEVRPYEPSDLSAVERILLAAYEYAMSPGMRSRLAIDARYAFVAERDGDAAGFVMASDYGGVAFIASMGVDPRHQHCGAGRALMTRLVDDLERGGVTAMLLDATAAGAPLYETFGFVDTDRVCVFDREATRVAPGEADVDAMELERAVEIDRALCRCDRSTIVRGFAREPGAFLAVRSAGYILAREDAIGPFVATGIEEAQPLLAAALEARPSARKLFVPESNAAALQLARDAGFVQARSLRHMERGKSPFPREVVFGQASLGHG